MKILEDLDLEFRTAEHMNGPGEWLWPKDDWQCWNYFNIRERDYFAEKQQDFYHLPHDIVDLLPKDCRRLVLQAGGNAGLYPAIYSGLFERVVTFEPHHRWFACLCVNAAQENVFKYRAAIGNDNNPVQMITPGANGPHPNMGGMFVRPDGTIPKLKLDAFGLDPDLIHLDIEGAEYDALQGAIDTINRSKPVIVVEWEPLIMRTFNYTSIEFEDFFASIGYVLQKTWERDRAYVHESNYNKDIQ
jgi:FkbM family methyltransferase